MKHKQKKSRFIKQIIFFLSTALLLVILTPSFSTNYQDALTAVQRNDLEKAQLLLNQTLTRNPNDLNSKTLYAIVTYRQGNFEDAQTQLLELSTNDKLSKNDSILYMLADAQNTLGLKEEALNTIITAYEVNPENLSIQQLYTSIYYDLSDEYAITAATSNTATSNTATNNTATNNTATNTVAATNSTQSVNQQTSQANVVIQAVEQVVQPEMINSRARNTESPTSPVASAGTVLNALNVAAQGTTLIPEYLQFLLHL